MATINVRLDDKVKTDAYAALDQLGITPSEAVRLVFQYIADTKCLPVKTLTINAEEARLIETVRERLNNPQKGIKVNLDDL